MTRLEFHFSFARRAYHCHFKYRCCSLAYLANTSLAKLSLAARARTHARLYIHNIYISALTWITGASGIASAKTCELKRNRKERDWVSRGRAHESASKICERERKSERSDDGTDADRETHHSCATIHKWCVVRRNSNNCQLWHLPWLTGTLISFRRNSAECPPPRIWTIGHHPEINKGDTARRTSAVHRT